MGMFLFVNLLNEIKKCYHTVVHLKEWKIAELYNII